MIILGKFSEIGCRSTRAPVSLNFVDASDGLRVSGAALRVPADDPLLDRFYKLSIGARVPVLILIGYTAFGARLPGGNGVTLDLRHPRHLLSKSFSVRIVRSLL